MKNIIILIVCILAVVGIISYQNKSESRPDLSQNSSQDGQTAQSSQQASNPSGQSASSTQVGQAAQTVQKADQSKTSNTQKTMEPTNITTATFHTNKGDITIEFFGQKSPNTVANFIKLASAGFYDGVKFHRVVKGFMIQGGDPLTKDDSKIDEWGAGGPGYTFADEFGTGNRNDIGTIAMANAGPNTNGSQFFINMNANNFLDGKHTVFGKVTSGMDVVNAIGDVPTEANQAGEKSRPVNPIVINSISLK